jgi:hypothetical protein
MRTSLVRSATSDSLVGVTIFWGGDFWVTIFVDSVRAPDRTVVGSELDVWDCQHEGSRGEAFSGAAEFRGIFSVASASRHQCAGQNIT